MPDPRGQARVAAMGMTDKQEAMIEIAITKFGSTTFTVGMLCESAGGSAEDCIKELTAMHALGAVRCPVNDGGCVLYEVIPELVYRAVARRR